MGEHGNAELAGQLGSLEDRVDPTTIFAERMAIRHAAKKGYVHADSLAKIAKSMLRRTAPKVADYRVGDLISFQREQNSKGEARKRWSPAARIIGFEGAKKCWVICEGAPFFIATDRMLSVNCSQALPYRYLHEDEDMMPPGHQQSYVD